MKTLNMLEAERQNIRNLIKQTKKDRVPVEYDCMIGMIKDRIKANKDNENITRRLENLLNDVKALSSIDLEEYDGRRHFVEDYD